MKSVGDKDWIEIQHNVDEFNRRINRLRKLSPDAVRYILRKIAFGIYRDLVIRTPVDTGTLRSRWFIRPDNQGFRYMIGNQTEYLLYVEYGIAYRPRRIPDDSDKRKRVLRYLFAKGILQERDGVIVYYYERRPNKSGWIRKTLQEWTSKAPQILRKYLKEWITREMSKR